MDHPKYVLHFDAKHPGCPFLIREYTVIDGKVAQRPHSSYPKLKKALEALSNLSGGELVLATSLNPADNSFDLRT